jgi:hypothetical protein
MPIIVVVFVVDHDRRVGVIVQHIRKPPICILVPTTPHYIHTVTYQAYCTTNYLVQLCATIYMHAQHHHLL